MLKWIVGSKADHPLADLKQVRALIAALAPQDYLKSLDEITRWLQWLCEAEDFKLERLLEVAELLDATAKIHQRKLLRDYLGMSRQQKFHENKLWLCGFNFAKALGATYLLCIRAHQKNAAGSNPLRKQVPALVARALRAIGMQVKWTMLRYGPFEPRLWCSIGELYRYAEEGGYTAATLQIYPGAHGGGTVNEEYLKIMMLWASNVDMLPPIQQEIAERVAAQFAVSCRTEKAPYAGAAYWFDHAAEKPPGRMLDNAPAGAELHYFGPGDAQSKVLEIAASMEKTGEVPSSLILSGTYSAEIVLAVLKHLSVYWSDTPPARASERRRTSVRITVVPGYSAFLDTLAREANDALNFSGTTTESWVVENVSESGYGALVPATAGDWIRVGELIGIQVEGHTEWGAGLLRRVMRDEQRQYHVGIEVISRAVVPVKISHGQGGHDAENAMLLSSQPDSNAEIGVVLRAGRYEPNSPVEVVGRTSSYLFTPARMVDAGDDFDRAIYTITRQPS